MRERGLEGGVKVTTRYKDLGGESYGTGWTLDPLLFESSGIDDQKGTNDLVSAVDKIREEGARQNWPWRAASRKGSYVSRRGGRQERCAEPQGVH